MSSVSLAWRLQRAGGRHSLATSTLSVIGFAITTVLLVLTVGTWSAFDAREHRTQWRAPAAATDPTDAAALQRTTTSAYEDQSLVIVDLAITGQGEPGTPPGLNTFPEPGQMYLSPPLAQLVAEHPEELGARFPEVTGELGKEALAHPEELVAVVGRTPGDAVMTAPAWEDQRRPGTYSGPTAIDSFTGTSPADSQAGQYRSLALVAAVLLIIPLLVLAGATARLGLARRDQRLAALRLAGATPSQVLRMTAAESGLTAAVGAALGIVGALLIVPFAARVPVGGGRWYVPDLVPPALVLAAILAGVVTLAVASSCLALRRVLSNPLGVASSQTPRRMSVARVLVFAALLVGFLRYADSESASMTMLVLVFAAVFGALAVIGPWAVGILGRVVVHRSRTAPALLAGRRMLDDPRGAWRVVGSVAMTGFVAGTLALFPTGGNGLIWGQANRIDVAVAGAAADSTVTELQTVLATAGTAAQVQGPGEERGALLFLRTGDQDVQFLSVTVHDPEADLETVRAAVAHVAPDSVAATGTDIMIEENQFVADFRTASVVVLAASFLIAMAAAGITAAASVLDRRRTYCQLALIGVPLHVLDKARTLETQLPLLLLTIGSTLTGVIVAAPLTRLGLGGTGMDVSGVLLLLACIGLGLLGVRAASAASRPLLARVAADPTSTSG